MNAAKTKPNAKRNERRAVVSAQQTIPYVAMHPDGICQLPGGLYTKTVEYEDINYAVRPNGGNPCRSSCGLPLKSRLDSGRAITSLLWADQWHSLPTNGMRYGICML